MREPSALHRLRSATDQRRLSSARRQVSSRCQVELAREIRAL